MTDVEAIAMLKDLIDYMESLKRVTRLRANSLILPNKTERLYYEYEEKKEWLRMLNSQLNGLKTKREKSRNL